MVGHPSVTFEAGSGRIVEEHSVRIRRHSGVKPECSETAFLQSAIQRIVTCAALVSSIG